MAKAKHVIWCTGLHGLYQAFLDHENTPPKITNSPCQDTILQSKPMLAGWLCASTQLVRFRCSPCLQTKAIPSCTMSVTISQLPMQLPMIQLPKTAVPSSREPEESPEIATLQKEFVFLTRIATVDMVLWDDARIIPCDSQLWAIQCTWRS